MNEFVRKGSTGNFPLCRGTERVVLGNIGAMAWEVIGNWW